MISRRNLFILLTLSLLLNVGVIGGFVLRSAANDDATQAAQRGHTFLANYLQLNESQKSLWRAKEGQFLSELDLAWQDIAAHRMRMIWEIFSDQPNAERVEAERAAIARLQEHQQRAVIAQLMEEREILNAAQRDALADYLIEQNPFGSLEQMLHEKPNQN